MCKVLIVENNPTIVKLVSHFFQSEGCDIRLADDGLQAMSVMESFIPDILFTDIIMPKIGGDVLCRIVRHTPKFKDIFIVIYSAIAYEDEKRIFELEADLYIAKGANVIIKDHIRHILDQFRSGKRREDVLHGTEDLHLRSITRELLISRRHYHAMLENLAEAVIEMDGTGQIVQVNKAAQELLVRDLATLLSSRLTDHLAGPGFNQVEEWFARVSTGGLQQFESGYDSPLLIGEHQVVLKLVCIAEKSEFFIIAILQDITKRKRVEKQLQILHDNLERRVEQRTRELQETQSQYLHAEKLSAIGKLSASIAHEFNNPLQGVMTILKGLRKRAILEEEDREMLETAIGESERMKNLLRSLQDFNRPSSGKKVAMDVHASIGSLLLLCKSDFKRKGISTALNYGERLPQVLAIPDQIKQVFLNLLNNAADACLHNGGMITISTRLEEKRVAVTIKDNGIGIEPEKVDLIFQPFYTSKHETKGTGLGLSVCHGIIENHQGEIRVETWPGEGSAFTVLLPAA
ncbi:MAG: hypothetical protein VR65_26765 [Desulfobulbaceae bacterium BRH_c16a]|nr:MAG: hypothetical protein VR65_26765 [Desulfobulbaceae bacterium BRH_c16a]